MKCGQPREVGLGVYRLAGTLGQSAKGTGFAAPVQIDEIHDCVALSGYRIWSCVRGMAVADRGRARRSLSGN